MAKIRIKAYQLGWSLVSKRGFFRFESDSGWSKPIPLPSADQVAAVGSILRSNAAAWWDADAGAVLSGDKVGNFKDMMETSLSHEELEGGDGPFPLAEDKKQREAD